VTEEFCFCDKVLKGGIPIGHPKHVCTPAPDPEHVARQTELLSQLGVELFGRSELAPPNEATRPWKPEDLDRCEHGRHSIDNCFSCPGGWSTGNLFLARIAVLEDHDYGSGERVRIGTTLGGDGIWVTPIRQLRPDAPATAHHARETRHGQPDAAGPADGQTL
jgi:hypothetical protein